MKKCYYCGNTYEYEEVLVCEDGCGGPILPFIDVELDSDVPLSLQEQSLEELFIKRGLLEQIIRENETDKRIGEPIRQLIVINSEIRKRKNEDVNEQERPPDLTVGLKSLNLKVKRT
jgi:hypothetical protein